MFKMRQWPAGLAVMVLVVIAAWPVRAGSDFIGILFADKTADLAAGYRALSANLHNHTIWTADDHVEAQGAETEIRQARRLVNIFGMSDHAEQISRAAWANQRRLAARYTDPARTFFVLAGAEWTLGGLAPTNHNPVAHINTFYSRHYFGTSPKVADWAGVPAPTLADVYRALAAEATANAGLIFQLNHPWANGHFNDMALPETNRDVLRAHGALVEVDSGLLEEMAVGIGWYERAIQQGWVVGPTANNDGPGGLPTQTVDRQTDVWVDRSAYAQNPAWAIWAALRDRRVAAARWGGGLDVFFGASYNEPVIPMGSRLREELFRSAVTLYLAVARRNGAKIGHRYLLEVDEVATGTVRRWRVETRYVSGRDRALSATVTVINRPDTLAYFLVLRDGAETVVTAPVWIPR